MARRLEDIVRSLPAERFAEPRNDFARLSPIERLRWLQQTAWFVWKHKGAARNGTARAPADSPGVE